MKNLALPLDFDMLDGVRLLAGRFDAMLAAGALLEPLAREIAELYVFRLWRDFGRRGNDWAELSAPWSDPETYPWTACQLAGLLESYCGWRGQAGGLIQAMLEAKVLTVERIGEHDGLRVAEFARFNPHLMPGFQSIQQKGGRVKAMREAMRRLEPAAEQQLKIMETQRVMVFEGAPTPEQKKKAIALVMWIDTALGRSLRSTAEYEQQKQMVAAAMGRSREFTEEEILVVMSFLRDNRANPSVPKETDTILRDFPALLEIAKG